MVIPTLKTSQLSLRPWKIEDSGRLFDILCEPDVLQYIPATSPPPFEKVEAYIARQLKNWQMHGYGHWAVVHLPDEKLIGWCGLEYLEELQETELAYLLSRPFWGQGLATQASQATLDYGFASASLTAVIGLVHPENIASQRVLEKCGLTYADQLTLWNMPLFRYRILKSTYLRDLRK